MIGSPTIWCVGNVAGKRVLVRVDYNVPLTEDGKVANNQRIAATLPTLDYLLKGNVKCIVLLSHLGRPDGVRVEKLSLKPVAAELERLLKRPITFLDDCVGSSVERVCAEADGGKIILLENLRFHLEEEGTVKRKDGTHTADESEIKQFRASLTKLGDICVNDAFGVVHRAHSSVTGIELPRVAGLLLSKELEYFSKVLESPDGIDLAIVGGAKVTDKIPLIKNLLPKVKQLAVGGAMAFTFLKTLHGMDIGKSLYDEEGAALVPAIMKDADRLGVKMILPVDFVTGTDLRESARVGSATMKDGIPADMMGLDNGPLSTQSLVEAIGTAKSILWNGPVGVFEVSHFAAGTKAVLQALAEATKRGAVTIVGGGDSGAAAAKWDFEDKLSHVSTGGGASLELLEGRELPGISALSNKD
ncbi:Phosphoglycerate kinase [Paramicrosporidium saccamoebae]|uniref:Phosphoglycerate kinase n=1 Tax=Paramicrosporidium saccamoebae TaxID=1246581 RepID=A0A2H9TKC1_9FUNG|nr:Phosphoglycerate kinase [Paramicrosporidium saccamoebae]